MPPREPEHDQLDDEPGHARRPREPGHGKREERKDEVEEHLDRQAPGRSDAAAEGAGEGILAIRARRVDRVVREQPV